MSPTKFGLEEKTVTSIKSVLKRYSQINKVLLYGSRAKGNFRNGSDIDLTLVAPDLTTTDLLKIENELEDLMLPYKIDLSLFHLIENTELIDHVKRVGQEF